MNLWNTFRLLAFVICAGVSVAFAQDTPPGGVSWHRIPQVRKALLIEATRLREEMAELPAFSNSRQIEAYGYHGGYLPQLDVLPEEPRWTVDVYYDKRSKLEEIILVPAIDPRFSQKRPYGFPRRYRVSVLLNDGSVSVVEEWLEEDAPDWGYVPRWIVLDEPGGSGIRVEVFKGDMDGDREFFALGELYGVVRDDIWNAKRVEVSRTFESLPYWSKTYLVDHKTGLGIPLDRHATHPVRVAKPDFIIEFEDGEPEECVIALDIGQKEYLGWVTLFPAMGPDTSVVPGYGFPGRIELFTAGRFGGNWESPGELALVNWDGGNPGDNAVRLPMYAREGRWLFLKCSDFAQHDGKPFFALGEIAVGWQRDFYTVESVSLHGFPEAANKTAPGLVDGMVDGQPILMPLKWFRLMERHYQLQNALDEKMSAEAALGLRWEQLTRRFWITLAVAALAVLAGIVIFRRHALQKLRLRLLEEHHQAEVDKMKLRFFTHISHELRTPLSVIPAPIERAMRAVTDPKLKNYLGMALRNVHDMQQLVEQILELRRIHDGKMRICRTEVDAVNVVGGIVESLMPVAADKQIDLTVESSGDPVPFCTDPQALKRMMGNLIGNALKYTPSGGCVRVFLSVRGEALICSVEDSGPGIPEADLSHIFEQHYRSEAAVLAHVPGSGIGLALVQELTELLSGTVTVQSPVADGRGSRFTIRIPSEQQESGDGEE